MAVWSWFIPIVVLFRPIQIMKEIWTATQHYIKRLNDSYQIKNGNLMIGIWWCLFLISNFLGRYILKTAFKDDTVQQMIEGTNALILSDCFQIPEALLVILIVSKLSKMEMIMADEVIKDGGEVVHKS